MFCQDSFTNCYLHIPSTYVTVSARVGNEEMLTFLVPANMDRSEKLKLVTIEKLKNPRCFKGTNSIPVTYFANKRAWMISQIFTKCVMRLDKDKKLSAEKRLVSCCLYIRLHSPVITESANILNIHIQCTNNTHHMIFSFLDLTGVSFQNKYGINPNSTIHLLISFYQYNTSIF